MKRTFAFGAAISQGDWNVQEDGYFVNPLRGLFALADGFGGKANGDLAAKFVLSEIRSRELPASFATEHGSLAPSEVWQRDLFQDLNKKLLDWNEKRQSASKGGCSLLLANISSQGILSVTQCGGCSAVLVRGGLPKVFLTPQAAPRQDTLGPLLLDQALGLGKSVMPESRSIPLLAGDIVLFASSGVEVSGMPFLQELSAQLALHLPGEDLSPVASQLVEIKDENSAFSWNRAIVVIEKI